jgi:uncharacterized OB-fold protein
MTTPNRIPVAADLFAETTDGPRLLGSKCASCGTPYFPRTPFCHNPECTERKVEDSLFGPRGTLWSCAIQNYPPPPPTKYDEPYTPYALGMIDLPEGLRVLGRIATDEPESLTPGIEVELVVEKTHTDPDGNDVVTWKFKPIPGAGS